MQNLAFIIFTLFVHSFLLLLIIIIIIIIVIIIIIIIIISLVQLVFKQVSPISFYL